ncbi:hypothetical protein DM806_06480 [Sphingobium lactosutens]|uniref:pilus assembly protein TadG-related protein n=1 Tax=Sphingobium lactosutens TaxID=522773 RepID=UPI0015B82E34|nr:pilus assembly protein TadG-related protein [Sphingobium lactosutens]NWK95315.1 hypothetical protein [Sphingobium lactosutens]
MRRLRRLRTDERGATTVIMVMALGMLIASAALVVDIGNLYVSKRRLQGAADAAAIAAAASAPDMRGEAVRRILAQQNFPGMQTPLIAPGRYVADPTVTWDSRFTAGAEAGAVQVTLQQNVTFFFGRFVAGRSGGIVQARATAARTDLASFSIGSRLGAFSGGLPNALLSSLLGTSVNLSVSDYNALASAKIDLLGFSRALGTSINANALTFDDILSANATLPQVLSALAATTGDTNAANALRLLAVQAPGTSVKLDQLIDLGAAGSRDKNGTAGVGSVDAYSMLREILMLANGGRQLALNTGLNIPGLTSAKIYLAIGQRAADSPWLAVARDNSLIIRTAQARAYLDTQVGGADLLGVASLRLPVYVELAQGQARLSAISCSGKSATVDLLVRPSPGHVAIADINTAQLGNMGVPVTENPVTLLQLLLVTATAKASIDLASTDWKSVRFTQAEIDAATLKTVNATGLVQGLTGSLVKGMDLRVQLLGLGLNLSSVTSLIGTVLQAGAPAVDALLQQVEDLLGLHIGQADVRVNGARCGEGTLVG